MPVDGKLLEILCCPVTRSPVNRLSAAQLKRLNEAIKAGSVRTVDGVTIPEPLQEALITESGKFIYRVDSGIPVMLADEAINTDQLPDGVL